MNSTTRPLIILGNDHGAVAAKLSLQAYLLQKGYSVINIGTDSLDSTHYPWYALKVGKLVLANPNSLGIVICSSGVGISIAANKLKGIRCMLCNHPQLAQVAKEQFNINVLGLGAKVIGEGILNQVVDSFLETKLNCDNLANQLFLDNI